MWARERSFAENDTSPTKKCIVWDLDNTLWDGAHLEGDVRVRPDARRAIEELDHRGILHSIASRGDEKLALEALHKTGLRDFFLVPQINWEPKPKNIIAISEALRLALDSLVFVDDEQFEREQVSYMLPEVMTIAADQAPKLSEHPFFRVEKVTPEALLRRDFYIAEQRRQNAQLDFPNREAFLKSCGMRLILRRMAAGDLPRVLELITRTHQLNTVGRLLTEEELRDKRFCVEVAELTDRFGGYGTVGAAVVENTASSWKLHLLAVTCRVLGRGIERAILATLLAEAGRGGLSQAEALYRDTGKNRAMLALYQMMGFRKCGCLEEGTAIFSLALERAPATPRWIEVV
jgi:FkbH-like protein